MVDEIDWDLIDIRLAVADGPEGKKRRDKLFCQLDPNGNRSLSLSEVLAGLGGLLAAESGYRAKDHVTEGLIPGITDFRPAITAAFRNARNIGKSSNTNTDNVDRTEFHALLVFFRHYLEIFVLFKDLDESEDMKLTMMEIMPNIASLRKWDITAKSVMQKLKGEPDGKMSFDHFAEWCLHAKLKDIVFDELEGAGMLSPPSSPTQVKAGKGKVDWALLDERIPTDSGADACAARDALFHKIDTTGSKHLSLTAVQASMTFLLQGDHAKGEVADTIIPGIRDTRPAVSCAFRAARDLAPPQGKEGKVKKSQKQKEDGEVDRREFHALLVYLRYYLELQVLFQDVDTSEDNRVSKEECNEALPLLSAWGIDKAKVQKKFDESKGELKFSNFADWCLRIKLNGQMFDSLEVEEEEEEEEEPTNETEELPNEPEEEAPGEQSQILGEQAFGVVQEAVEVGVQQEVEAQSPQEEEDTSMMLEAERVFDRSLPASPLSNFRLSTPLNQTSKSVGTPMRRVRPPVNEMSKSSPTLTFVSSGVLQRPPHLKTLSHIRSLPKWKFGEKRPSSFLVQAGAPNPAPGSYALPPPERTGKFRESSGSSFGAGASRFGYEPHPGKLQPAPGEYGIPKHPVMDLSRKSGFGKVRRGNLIPVMAAGPGPGAYEAKSTLAGVSCTAKGKLQRAYKPTAALPGPGAYHPKQTACLTHERNPAQIGFGTGPAREDFSELHCNVTPGPGAYEHETGVQQFGKASKKFSFQSRLRSASNFNSYITPGPGSYDGDGTCFGY